MNSNERNVIIERHHVVKQTIKSLALNAAKIQSVNISCIYKSKYYIDITQKWFKI